MRLLLSFAPRRAALGHEFVGVDSAIAKQLVQGVGGPAERGGLRYTIVVNLADICLTSVNATAGRTGDIAWRPAGDMAWRRCPQGIDPSGVPIADFVGLGR